MPNKPTLTQYLESKRQLMEAVKHDPVIDVPYKVTKYCKLVVENDSDQTTINLRPGMECQITWKYALTEHLTINEVDRDPLRVVIRSHGQSLIEGSIIKTKAQLERWITANVRQIRS